MTSGWTPWRPFATPIKLRPRVLAELVDGGQAFRWWPQPDGTYLGQWSNHVAALRLAPAPSSRSGDPPDTPAQSRGSGFTPDNSAPPRGSGFTPDIPAPPRGSGFTPDIPAPPRGSNDTPDIPPPPRGSGFTPDIPAPPDVGGAFPLNAPASLEWSSPADQAAALATTLPHYLGFTPAQAQAIDQLPWRSDPHLARCLNAYPDLRILHQPLGETLLAFLCSATKQIVQIKQMLALLAEHHGSPHQTICPLISDKLIAAKIPGFGYHLPTWDQLAASSEEKLRACQLGFRARYIFGTAKFLSARPGWLEETGTLPYAAAKTRLLTLPGVGEKIADCVLLFGGGHLAAFPVDTWMIKSMARRYELSDWKPPQIAHFGRTHFGAAAGLAQQVLFAWEREFGKSAI